MAEYVCGDCGAQIGLSDERCLGCGAVHPYGVQEQPLDEPEAELTRGSFGYWALGAVFFMAVGIIAMVAGQGI